MRIYREQIAIYFNIPERHIINSSGVPIERMSIFIRFTLLYEDETTERKTGILIGAHEFRDSTNLSVEENRELQILLDWFDKSLPIPRGFNHYDYTKALSWFKPGAKSAVKNMWDLKRILDLHNVHVAVHKTSDPGYIIYEDEIQILAIPWPGQKIS